MLKIKMPTMKEDNDHKSIDKNELLSRTEVKIEKNGLQVIMVGSTDYMLLAAGFTFIFYAHS